MMEPLDDGGLIFLRGDLATLSTLQRLERGLGFVVEGLGFFVGGMPAALRPQERLERGEGCRESASSQRPVCYSKVLREYYPFETAGVVGL